MLISVEVSLEEFERIAAEKSSVLDARIARVEVRQEAGLLSLERACTAIVPMSLVVARQEGLADGDGPAMRIFIRKEE